MSADTELRRYYRGGCAALRVLEKCTPVPREPRERVELFRAMRMLSDLVRGYDDSDSDENAD